jgi:PAS domain S-box-containing protein
MYKEKIMILTDDDGSKNNLIKKLKSWNYHTCSFPTTSSVLPESTGIKPDLIIMDLNPDREMEEVNVGADVIKKYNVPLIYLSNEINGIDGPISIKPYTYIKKPFNDNELKLAVEIALYREKIDKRLKTDEANFRLFYERSPIPYHSLDSEGKVLEVNESWLAKLGYKREDVIGRWFPDFLAPRYIKPFDENFKKLREDGEIYAVNFEMIQKDGNRINVTIDCKIVDDENGNFKLTHCVFIDITGQKKAEEALKESEQYYKTIFENTGTATVIVEEDNTISLINTEFEKLYGYNKEDIEGKMEWHQFVVEKYHPMMEEYHKLRRKNPELVPRNYEFDIVDSKGTLKNIFATIAIIPGTGKSLVSLQDITERNNTENQLKTSLKDKDMLLREIHHRVKNNLQIISSLLNLQSRYITDGDALDVFSESQNRVRSMAIIHEKLYNSESMSEIDFGEYISDLTESLFYNYRVNPSKVKLKENMEEIFFDVDTAIPCGLIVNELITNCLKHAFPGDTKGEICIELFREDDKYVLIVKDDGVGFPEDIDFKNTESLGLQLVINLVSQIEGTVELDGTNGSSFNIIFNELEYKNRV